MKTRFALLCVLAVLVPCITTAEERIVTTQSLLDELIDYNAVARWPEPEYVCRQASSYDRASKTADDAKGWFANGDQNQFIRTETVDGRTEKVMLDADGPGAIVRFWLTCNNNKQGTIRIYLDGAAEPTIAVPAFDFVSNSVLQAGIPLLTSHPGSSPISRGGNTLFLPIPYAKHCKVTWEEGTAKRDSRYYQINYRTYSPSTKVETFAANGAKPLDALRAALDKVNVALANPPAPANCKDISRSETIAPGAKLELDLPAGAAAVRELSIEPNTTDAQALRSLVLAASFDGEQTIWCPASDFFGSGVGANVLASWYRTVDANSRMTCRWVMPYQKSAQISLQNLGKEPVRVKLLAKVGEWKWDDRSMHFRANWRQQYPIATRPYSDWNFITATGKGVYVGDTLCIMNPVTAWWGEGDEKISVDDEPFPSHFGTGTEDYYCYSWSDPRKFQTPFANQVRCDGPGTKGQTVVTRTCSLDAIPFTKSLNFDMEVWHWSDCQVAYAATTYWYARPGATSNRKPDPDEAARALPSLPPPLKIAGALECETLKILAKSLDVTTETQSGALSEGEWSGDAQLFVNGKVVGDFIELQIPATEPGRKKLTLYGTKSWDYGILRFSLNGQPAGKDFDAFNARPMASGPIELGEFEPKDGQFVLRVEVIGANPASKNSKSFFGLDVVTVTAP
jgi:hypothetical protein